MLHNILKLSLRIISERMNERLNEVEVEGVCQVADSSRCCHKSITQEKGGPVEWCREQLFMLHATALYYYVLTCIVPEIVIRSLSISCKCRVPIVFRRVVCASSLVEW